MNLQVRSVVSALIGEESESDFGDEDISSMVNASVDTPYGTASEAYRRHYSIYKDGPEAWVNVFYSLGLWMPGESNASLMRQVAYHLAKSLKEFKAKRSSEDVDAYVRNWVEGWVREVTKTEAQVQGICQLWKALATS